MPTIAELREGLEIDKSELDNEVTRQPVLFYTVSEMLTQAIAERDAAKENLTLVDADLDRLYRSRLNNTNNSKRITEAVFASHVVADDKHTEAFTAWLDSKTRADKLLALKEAFQQRSYMLRDLVSLYSANYYEDASVKPTRAQEASHYSINRDHIARARALKHK